jgi:muramoyltetrapeptide carboxypeptidase
MSPHIIPPYLQPGDTIAIVAPARSVTHEQMAPAVRYLESKGYRVRMDEELFRVHHQFAGTEQERADFFNKLLKDPAVKALWCARGGYGSGRMIDLVDFDLLKVQPKWIAGFSDESMFLNHIDRHCRMANLHSTMPIFMSQREGQELKDVELATDSFLQALEGRFQSFDLSANQSHHLSDFEGEVIGGNLSVLCSMAGSVSESDWDGRILFIEDLDEFYYHIDRMMLTLKRSGKLDRLKALLVGSFIQMHDHTVPFGYDVREIILQHCGDKSYPVIFDVNSGHHLQNMTIPFGVPAKFKNALLTFATP